MLLLKQLHPIVLIATNAVGIVAIANSQLVKARVEDIAPVPRRIHPTLYYLLRSFIASGNVFACAPRTFEDSHTALAIGPGMAHPLPSFKTSTKNTLTTSIDNTSSPSKAGEL